MTLAAKFFNYCRANPIAVYLGGGVGLYVLRNYSVEHQYQTHFLKHDVERKLELQEYLAQGNTAHRAD